VPICWQRNKNNYIPRRKGKLTGMDQHTLVALDPSYRNAGRAAITSGVIGIAAFGLLMDAVLTRVLWIPPLGFICCLMLTTSELLSNFSY
jgi:hypothetical protein